MITIAHSGQPRINNLRQGPILVRDLATHIACRLKNAEMRDRATNAMPHCNSLPTAGRKTQLFHIIFTEPGQVNLEVPCSLTLVISS